MPVYTARCYVAALLQQDKLIGIVQPQIGFMINGDQGAPLRLHLDEHRQQPFCFGFVQIGKAFIQQDAAAFQKIQARQRSLLLFAARQGRQRAVKQVGNLQFCGSRFDFFVHLTGGYADIFQAKTHFCPQGVHAKLQVGVLEQYRQIRRTLLGVQSLQVMTKQPNVAALQITAVFGVQPCRHRCQGAFAAAAAAHNHRQRTGGNVEVGVVQNVVLTVFKVSEHYVPQLQSHFGRHGVSPPDRQSGSGRLHSPSAHRP